MYKFDQIAYHVPNIDEAIKNQNNSFYFAEWKHDIVRGKVSVFGSEFNESMALLSFNYDSPVEYELLHYVDGPNWHEAKGKDFSKVFLSHMGIHTQEMEEAIRHFQAQGFSMAQQMHTLKHENPYLIEKKRTYHYVIFDTEKAFGFDTKLIKRIEA